MEFTAGDIAIIASNIGVGAVFALVLLRMYNSLTNKIVDIIQKNTEALTALQSVVDALVAEVRREKK